MRATQDVLAMALFRTRRTTYLVGSKPRERFAGQSEKEVIHVSLSLRGKS
jgi:hypothetical protein